MTDSIKTNNVHPQDINYLSNLIKQSSTLTHLNNYPLLNEISSFFLSFYIISYFATLVSKISLDFKNEILLKYFKFSIDWIDYFDKLFDIYILGNIDQYLPILGKIHLKDLYPSNIYNVTINQIKLYYQFSIAKIDEFKENQFKPTIISNTNPIIAPINSKLSTTIDNYLPSDNSIEPSPVSSSSSELSKFSNLLTLAYQRSKPLILGKFQNVKQYPTKIQSIYNDELNKNDQNITKAITNTSIEISNKIGLTNGKKEVKTNGSSNVGLVPNGEISVNA